MFATPAECGIFHCTVYLRRVPPIFIPCEQSTIRKSDVDLSIHINFVFISTGIFIKDMSAHGGEKYFINFKCARHSASIVVLLFPSGAALSTRRVGGSAEDYSACVCRRCRCSELLARATVAVRRPPPRNPARQQD